MSVASERPGGADARRPRLAVVPGGVARAELRPLAEEAEWWPAAPLRDGRRALCELPAGAVTRLADHYLPFVLRSLRPQREFLATHLGGRDDVDAQSAEWLLTAMCCYDPARGVPFAGYLASRLPHWVADAVRGRWAERTVAEDETAYARAVEQSLRERHRPPTLAELAERFGEDPAVTARRLQAVALRRGLRRPGAVDGLEVDALAVRGGGAVWTSLPFPEDGGDADARLLALDERATVTAALVAAAAEPGDGDGVNARGLWTLLLEHLGEFPRCDLEHVGHVGRVAIVTAQARLVTEFRRRLAAAS